MLEYPELNTITNQMKKELIGKTIISGLMVKRSGNMFMGEDEPLKYALLNGGKIIDIDFFAPEIFIVLDNGHGILFCQSGGSIIYHKTAADVNKSCNIRFDFTDGSCLTYTMLLWTLGIYAITCDEWNLRKQRGNMQYFKPLDKNTFEDYLAFINRCKEQEKMPIKIFLSKYITGVMSTFAAEILLYAKIYPSVQLKNLNTEEHRRIYTSIKEVLT
ncbi:MAG: Formamidopyrimidine-DNA glycosylase N-terminal domain, partial [Clostridia bacterium]|nr:Formamidopyrimidine-DNA glycosylase N-terminal domain [Clostridia bacterium]